MAAIDCARAILKYVDRDTAVIFVAIAGPESAGTYRLDVAGDGFGGYWSCMTDDCRRRGWSKPCQSFGPWQINMPAHYPWLSQMAGTNEPCRIARWLTASYDNNARAAYTVWRRQGFGAWAAYKNGSYRNYISQARQAVDAALAEQPQPPGSQPQPPQITPPAPPFLLAAALGAVALGGAGAALVVFANRERIKQWWYNRAGGWSRWTYTSSRRPGEGA